MLKILKIGLKEENEKKINTFFSSKTFSFFSLSENNFEEVILNEDWDLLVLGQNVGDPVELARKANLTDKCLSVAILARYNDLPFINQKIEITNFTGNAIQAIYIGYDSLPAELEKIAEKTRQRREYFLFQTEEEVKIPDNNKQVKGKWNLSSSQTKLRNEVSEKDGHLMQQKLYDFIYKITYGLIAYRSNLEGIGMLLKECKIENTGKDEPTDNSTISSIAESLIKSSYQINQVWTRLLVFAQLQHESNTCFQDISLKSSIYTVLEELKNLEWNFETEINISTSECDTIRLNYSYLHTLFFELITNSVLSGAKAVNISSMCIDNKTMIIVSDNGKGIPTIKKDKILLKLRRPDLYGSDGGLGLYFVKKIVDQYKGQIDLETEVDKGTTIRLVFPQTISDNSSTNDLLKSDFP